MMKICLVTGSYPPDSCGVGDYAAQLVGVLQKRGLTVEVLRGAQWGLFKTGAYLQRIKDCKPDVVHIQYPTVGYGQGLCPQVLVLFLRPRGLVTVVTVHEFSQSHLLRKLSNYPLLMSGAPLIFTTTPERDCARRWYPAIHNRSTVINIGSNIPFLNITGWQRHLHRISYFGLIKPKKGLEEFVELVQLAVDEGRSYDFHIIGLPNPRYEQFYHQMLDRTKNLPVTWHVGLSREQVARQLNQAAFIYLPFPDGASQRRGTLLAALGNGAVVITRVGRFTPEDMQKVVVAAQNPREALAKLDYWAAREEKLNVLAQQGRCYAANYTWETVADNHIKFYHRILST